MKTVKTAGGWIHCIRRALLVPLWGGWIALSLLAQESPAPAAAADKDRAYQSLNDGAPEEAAVLLRRYLDSNPNDLAAAMDYGLLLEQLDRLAEAAQWFEAFHARFPQHEPAYFHLGALYRRQDKFADAESVFEALSRSDNGAMAEAAGAALERLRSERDLERRYREEQQVFALADQGAHDQVIEAVRQLEVRGSLSFRVALQRAYALYHLEKYEEALRAVEDLQTQHPARTEPAWLRAEILVRLKRVDQALAIWRELETARPESDDAREARRRRMAFDPPPPPVPAVKPPGAAEERIFRLAREGRDADVVAAVDELETREGALFWTVALQRLYSLYNLGRYELALTRANELAILNPHEPNLGFLRAELLIKLDRAEEARAVWREVQSAAPDAAVAAEAAKRLVASTPPPIAPPNPEQAIYDLAKEGRHRKVIEAVEALERQGPVSWPMELQRLYALKAEDETERALLRGAQLDAIRPGDPDLAWLRGDLLSKDGRWAEASSLLLEVREAHPEAAVAGEVQRRLEAIPLYYRQDKWYWGEAYFSGDYFGRFGAVVGAGMARHGWFIPGARWLQPYGEFQFGVDTEEGIGAERTIIVDNHVGFYGGVRAQLWPMEYLFAYAQAGTDKDLLDRRSDGDWDYDYQAGIYGYRSWGPGASLNPAAVAFVRSAPDDAAHLNLFWRRHWLIDGGANFSYYHRYANWIGYAQSHQGWRLFQIGPKAGFDVYAVENLSWDTQGNYFDNLIEFGPGCRWVWTPCPRAEVVLRTEWMNGFYMGRDDEDTRGDASGQYDEVRVGLSVGMRW